MSLREQLVSALESYSEDDFVEVAAFEDILGGAYFESREWMTEIFGERNDPHNPANSARHFYHLWRGEDPGFDLLRHTFERQSRSVVVTESVPVIHTEIHFGDRDRERGIEPVGRANAVTSWLLDTLVSFEADGDGWLSTDPDLPVDGIRHWRQRIDARIGRDTLQLVVYRERPRKTAGPRNLTVWFDEDFRENPPGKRLA